MPTAFRCSIAHGSDALARSAVRYDLLRRLAVSAAARDVTVLAFGLGDDELRLVLDGPPVPLERVVRGVKSGTSRAARSRERVVLWESTEEEQVSEAHLARAVAWAHRAPGHGDPLTSPWTSHRDLLGLRHADFFDASVLAGRVRATEVHALAGGGPLPQPPDAPVDDELNQLLRVAAAVVGVQPANRRCFRLFVHLARSCGFHTRDLARALMLTGRRIRQLAQGQEPLLPAALTHLADPRLARVP